MTRDRVYGEDTEFSRWMRSNKNLPSYSSDCGFVATDSDFLIHRYMTVVDGKGTREVQGIMHLEAKTRGATPTKSQADTLFKLNAFRGDKRIGNKVRYFGVSIVSFSGTSPIDSHTIHWGRFRKNTSSIKYTEVTVEQLESLLLFERCPDSLQRNPYRRHHKSHELIVEEHLPLGFPVQRIIRWKS